MPTLTVRIAVGLRRAAALSRQAPAAGSLAALVAALGCGGQVTAASSGAGGGSGRAAQTGPSTTGAGTGSGTTGAGAGGGSVTTTGSGGAAGSAGHAQCHGRVPQNHRAEGSTCPAARGPGGGPFGQGGAGPGACNVDADCTMGKNGRCEPRGGGAFITACSYDACFTDSDCAGNLACICRPAPSSSAPNVCATGSTCRVDSDCGVCRFCSPSEGAGFCGGQDTQLFCHTGSDTCLDDADCQGSGCNYDPTAGHWMCKTECSPPPP